MPSPDSSLASEPYCYLTTTGRRSGEPHTIEIWFALQGDKLYILAGGRERSDWVLNAVASPSVAVRIGATTYAGTARAVSPGTDEDALARRLLLEKYATPDSDLGGWGRTALPMAVALDAITSTDPADARWP